MAADFADSDFVEPIAKRKPGLARKTDALALYITSEASFDKLVATLQAAPNEAMTAMTKFAYKVLQASDVELERAYQQVLQNTDANMVWVGSGRRGSVFAVASDNRPRVSFQTAAYQQCKVTATHVVLVRHGHLPPLTGLQASHYCHNAACMAHLTWEPDHFNEILRKKCFKARTCSCGLTPGCRFDLH